ncbi:MAG: methyltransferase domain-containing protein [Candidatus Taylorbacteria bacterium]
MKTKSFLRVEELRALANLHINGKILDVGGSKKSGYHELIGGSHTIITGNIDPSYGIDVQFDAQKKWPYPDSSFDCVLFVNLLEHLYDYKSAVSESHRVLKSNGMVAGVVPFMFNVHGSPNDYFRYTRSALERIFSDAGFTSITVAELGSGAFSVIYHNLLGFIRWNWLARLVMPLFRICDRTLAFIKPNNKMSQKFMPLGYYFEAKK